MTSAIPGIIQWTTFVFVATVIVGRHILVDQTPMDHLGTRALVFGLVCDMLRNDAVQHVIVGVCWVFDDAYVINVVRQASFGPLLLSIMCIYGMARFAFSPDDDLPTVRRRQRRYDAVALAATAVILAAGTPARAHNMLIDEYHGWGAAIVWIAYYSVLAVSSLSIINMMIGELRSGDNTGREIAIYIVVLGYFGYLTIESIYVPVDTVISVLADSAARDPSMQFKALTAFVALIAGTAILTVPLIGAVLVRIGWDRPGRYCRRIRPLWRDLTDAYPEVVLERPATGTSVDSISQLHRMTMEIRDCLVRLNRYAPEGRAVGSGRDQLCGYAHRISAAVVAKQRGQLPPPPAPGRAEQAAHTTQRRDLEAELNQLVELSRIWRRVHQPCRRPGLFAKRHRPGVDGLGGAEPAL
ncbi:MAB_1171c family putative transporter [Nocardia suismassiliense]|uniref:MAB_1171c family putative transporter n=1 Tax=Nocardia suismassiliense TaxID=2077092 RepID=UPI000D1F1D2B|nr:MAB_1171c family putative transporter [Nocardia suismassiliense]